MDLMTDCMMGYRKKALDGGLDSHDPSNPFQSASTLPAAIGQNFSIRVSTPHCTICEALVSR